VDPVPDPLLRKSGSAGNRTRTSGSVARNPDGGPYDVLFMAELHALLWRDGAKLNSATAPC
jgi:hypothetical protein